MKTKFYVAIMAAGLLAGTASVFTTHAAEKGDSQHPVRGRLMQRAKENLGITDAQAAEIKAQLKSEKPNITSLLTRLHDARADLRHEIQSGDATEESVRAASAKVAAVEAEVAVERMKLHSKIAPILTTDQQNKLAEMQSRVDDFVDRRINRIGQRHAE